MKNAFADIDRMTFVETGARYRAHDLTQQAGYTLQVAHGDGPALVALLPSKHFLDDVRALESDVETSRNDKTNAAADSKGATALQNDDIRALKTWQRKVSKRALRAKRLGKQVDDALLTIGGAKTVKDVLDDTADKLTHLASAAKALESVGPGVQAMIGEGKKLYEKLKADDITQETKRLADLPKAVQDFYAAKGQLYVALKVINDAGQELHAGDLAAAAKFNLKLLHRHAARGTSGATDPAGNAPAAPAGTTEKK